MSSTDRLVQYQQQLKQIETILESASNDAELLSLKNDIIKLIAITEADIAKSHTTLSSSTPSSTTSSLVSSSSSVIPPQLPSSTTPNDGIHTIPTSLPSSSSSSTITTDGSSNPAVSSRPLTSDIQSNSSLSSLPYIFRYKIGDKVEGLQLTGAAEGHNAWYPGIVIALHPDIHQVTVRFIGVPILLHGPPSSDRTVDESILRSLVLPTDTVPEQNIKPGYTFLAKWTVDGAWYTARIDEITNMDHIRVTFTDYGNTEIVPKEYLQPLPSSSSSSSAATTITANSINGTNPVVSSTANHTLSSSFSSASHTVVGSSSSSSSSATATTVATTGTKRTIGESTTTNNDEDSDEDDLKGAAAVSFYAGLVIPEYLRALPTDTEADRLRKRKKIKVLKQNYKRNKLEEEAKQKVNSWQSFMANNNNKRPRSVLQ